MRKNTEAELKKLLQDVWSGGGKPAALAIPSTDGILWLMADGSKRLETFEDD